MVALRARQPDKVDDAPMQRKLGFYEEFPG
jgi:hypothetical protein